MRYSTHKDGEHHWTAPPPTRCHSCTAIDKKTKEYEHSESPRALRFRAAPSEGLAQAMADPRLAVAPPLPTGPTGELRATPQQLAAWLAYHDQPIPDGLVPD